MIKNELGRSVSGLENLSFRNCLEIRDSDFRFADLHLSALRLYIARMATEVEAIDTEALRARMRELRRFL